MKITNRLFATVVMMLSITVATAADYSGYYRIKGTRSSRLAIEESNTLKIKATSGNTTDNLAEIWEIRKVGTDDNSPYVIINAATGHMVLSQTATSKEHSLSATSANLFYIKKSGTQYVISFASDFSDKSCWHEDSSNKIVVWTEGETYSKWVFTKISTTNSMYASIQQSIAQYENLITAAVAKAGKMSVLDNGGIFRLKSRYDRYATESSSTHKVSSTDIRKANDLKQIWVIIKDGTKFHIRNAYTGRFLPDDGGSDAALVTTDAQTDYYIKASEYSADYFTISWNESYKNGTCLHENASHNVVKWNANNASDGTKYSDWTIEPVDESDTDATIENLRKRMAEMQGIATSVTTGAYRLVPAAYPTRALTEDMTTNGVTTTLKTDRYSQVWQLTVSEDGKTVTFQNLLSDKYVKNSASTSAQYKTQTSTTGTSFTIGTGGGDWNVYFNFKGSSTGFHCASSSDYKVVGWDANAEASQWILYPVKVDEAALQAEKQEMADIDAIKKSLTTINTKLQIFFEDFACTKLREAYAGVEPDALRAAMEAEGLPTVIQDMGVAILTNTWVSGKTEKYNNFVKLFRIQDVECYSDNKEWQKITQVGPFGELTSPTGIQGKTGEYAYIYVDQAAPTSATLRALLAYDTEYRNKGEMTLKKGLNIWQFPCDGEIFITYFCTDTKKYLKDFPKIRVHIEGATANGYWDLSRDMTNSDWSYLKSNFFKGEFLHVKGMNTVLNVLKDKVKDATKPVEIMKGWDYAFLGLQKAIGHTGQWDGRYNPVVNPRHSYSGNPNWGGYGGSNHTGITSGYLFNYDNFYKNNVWEILHEIGHGCQYPIKMAGTTEVTNNSLAQIVSHMMGNNYSRGNGTDRLVQLFNYEKDGKRGWSWVDYVRYATPFYDSSLHTGNHLLYQLYLYFEVMGHNPGFLTRMHNEMRANPITYSGKDQINGTPKTYNDDFWKFAKACATASQTDLWEFFEAYGFWKYADEIISTSDDDPTVGSAAYNRGNRFIGDYGNYSMKLPVRDNAADEAAMQELYDYMKAMPNKAPNVLFIDDHVRKNTVDPNCFVAQIEKARAGQELAKYWDVPFVDYGDYRDFDGKDHTSGLGYSISSTSATQSYTTDKGGEWNYSVTGRRVTMQGEGILGVKIYDAAGKLVQLANTKTFVIPTEMAEGLKAGTYKMYVAATASLDIEMDKEGKPIIPEGIGQLTTGNGQRTTDRCYDLMGRTYNHQPKSGLYIQRGKKVLVR